MIEFIVLFPIYLVVAVIGLILAAIIAISNFFDNKKPKDYKTILGFNLFKVIDSGKDKHGSYYKLQSIFEPSAVIRVDDYRLINPKHVIPAKIGDVYQLVIDGESVNETITDLKPVVKAIYRVEELMYLDSKNNVHKTNRYYTFDAPVNTYKKLYTGRKLKKLYKRMAKIVKKHNKAFKTQMTLCK